MIEIKKLILLTIKRLDGSKRKKELILIRRFIKNSEILKGNKRKLYKLIDSNIN